MLEAAQELIAWILKNPYFGDIELPDPFGDGWYP